MFQFDYAGADRQIAKLEEEAENLRALAKQIKTRNEALELEWDGNASEAYLSRAEAFSERVNQAQKIIEDCITEFQQAVARIRATEAENEEAAKSL